MNSLSLSKPIALTSILRIRRLFWVGTGNSSRRTAGGGSASCPDSAAGCLCGAGSSAIQALRHGSGASGSTTGACGRSSTVSESSAGPRASGPGVVTSGGGVGWWTDPGWGSGYPGLDASSCRKAGSKARDPRTGRYGVSTICTALERLYLADPSEKQRRDGQKPRPLQENALGRRARSDCNGRGRTRRPARRGRDCSSTRGARRAAGRGRRRPRR